MRRWALLVFALAITACSQSTTTPSSSTSVTTTTSGAPVEYSAQTIGKLEGVVDLVERSPEDNWFYVVSQKGTIERWTRDGNRIDTVLDITAMTQGEGERGLLGFAVRHLPAKTDAFINYTNNDGDTVISWIAVNDDGTLDNSRSITGTAFLTIKQPYANHNGGGLAIGPDNFLYIGTGDGGSANDPERRALDTSSLLGKILRIDPNNIDGVGNEGYTIPSDNPYVSTAGARPEIWAIGLRNPWRFTFDSFGNLWIADVGQNKWEEISIAPRTGPAEGQISHNFGWSAYEGTHRFNSDVIAQNPIMPVYEYPHDNGACSISGGAIGTNSSAMGRAGWFYFGDYCTGTVSAILSDGSTTVASEEVLTDMGNITAIRSTHSALYVLSQSGEVRQLTVTRK
jgi:glucose/arabinose dehydrogenase